METKKRTRVTSDAVIIERAMKAFNEFASLNTITKRKSLTEFFKENSGRLTISDKRLIQIMISNGMAEVRGDRKGATYHNFKVADKTDVRYALDILKAERKRANDAAVHRKAQAMIAESGCDEMKLISNETAGERSFLAKVKLAFKFIFFGK